MRSTITMDGDLDDLDEGDQAIRRSGDQAIRRWLSRLQEWRSPSYFGRVREPSSSARRPVGWPR